MKSCIASNPDNSAGWIQAARIEEMDGKVEEARKIIQKACAHFYSNEDVWLEAIRLNPSEAQRPILAQALKQMPKSKKLWVMAVK